jgi:hypothetical protein
MWQAVEEVAERALQRILKLWLVLVAQLLTHHVANLFHWQPLTTIRDPILILHTGNIMKATSQSAPPATAAASSMVEQQSLCHDTAAAAAAEIKRPRPVVASEPGVLLSTVLDNQQ